MVVAVVGLNPLPIRSRRGVLSHSSGKRWPWVRCCLNGSCLFTDLAQWEWSMDNKGLWIILWNKVTFFYWTPIFLTWRLKCQHRSAKTALTHPHTVRHLFLKDEHILFVSFWQHCIYVCPSRSLENVSEFMSKCFSPQDKPGKKRVGSIMWSTMCDFSFNQKFKKLKLKTFYHFPCTFFSVHSVV